MATSAASKPRAVRVSRALAVCFLCGGILWLSFLHPIFVYSARSEFNLADGRIRQSDCLLGVRYRTVEDKGSALSPYLGSTKAASRCEWVLLEQHGFLFPMDLFGLDHCIYPQYARVPRDIELLSNAWEDAEMEIQVRRGQANRYLELLRSGKDREASRYAAQTKK